MRPQGTPQPCADVVGLGATTPVGLDLRTTETSVRAGVVRFRESGFFRRRQNAHLVLSTLAPEYLPALAVEGSGTLGSWQRMVRLSTHALAEASAGCPRAVPLLLALPEPRWGTRLPSAASATKQLAEQASVALDERTSRLYPQGGAGGLLALRDALRMLDSRQCPFVLVGGVDSFLDLQRLALLDAEGRLLGGGMDGFIPGEGAAFLLLCAPGVARQHRLEPFARIVGVGVGVEPGHRYSEEPYRGDGLAQAFQTLFATLPPGTPKVGCVYAGFNGESLPTKEWGVGYLRNAERFVENVRVEHPADCVGDAGAALGPLMLALAAARLHAGLHAGPALVWSTSDHEARAAALLEAAPG